MSKTKEELEVNGAERILAERKRQIEKEGWTDRHDDELEEDELARAAACYAMPKAWRKMKDDWNVSVKDYLWPWDNIWWKPSPKKRIRELEKAGALIAAEIDRLLRRQRRKTHDVSEDYE